MLDQLTTHSGAQRCSYSDHRSQRSGGKIEAAGAASPIGDDKDRDDDEDSVGHSIEDLDRDQRPRCVGERVEHAADWQDTETNQE